MQAKGDGVTGSTKDAGQIEYALDYAYRVVLAGRNVRAAVRRDCLRVLEVALDRVQVGETSDHAPSCATHGTPLDGWAGPCDCGAR